MYRLSQQSLNRRIEESPIFYDQEIWSAPCKPDKILRHYRNWCRTKRRRDLNGAVRHVVPYIRINSRLRDAHAKDVVNETLFNLYSAIRDRSLPNDEEGFFKKLLKITIDSIRDPRYLPTATFHSSYIRKRGILGDLPRGYLITQENVEYKIFIEDQLPRLIARGVVKDIRFQGNQRKACLYVLERILTDKRPIPFAIHNRFHVEDPEFYIDYIIVLIRKTLYSIRDDLFDGHVISDWHEVISQVAVKCFTNGGIKFTNDELFKWGWAS